MEKEFTLCHFCQNNFLGGCKADKKHYFTVKIGKEKSETIINCKKFKAKAEDKIERKIYIKKKKLIVKTNNF